MGMVRFGGPGPTPRRSTVRPALSPRLRRLPFAVETKPIVIGRHAHGDQYKSQNFTVGEGTVTMKYTPADGSDPVEYHLFDFKVRLIFFPLSIIDPSGVLLS